MIATMAMNIVALRDALVRYDAWLAARPNISEAMCWTVAVSGDSAQEAMDCFSADWSQSAPVTFEELVDMTFAETREESSRPHFGWLVTTGSHVALLEINGFGGSTVESLRAWSHRYPRVAGMFWNVNSVNRLSIGHGDQVETFEMVGGDDDAITSGPMIGMYSPMLSGEVSWAAGLAIVEAETDLRLDDRIVAHSWPVVHFAGRELSPRLPRMRIAHDDVVLAMALMNAVPDRLMVAMTVTAEAVVDASALGNEPGAALAVSTIGRGASLRPLPRGTTDELLDLLGRLWMDMENSPHRPGDPHDPAFQRYQAAATLESFTDPRKRDDGWLHAKFALADGWEQFRDQLLEILA